MQIVQETFLKEEGQSMAPNQVAGEIYRSSPETSSPSQTMWRLSRKLRARLCPIAAICSLAMFFSF
jgi:hypothetical protein